MGFRIDIWIHMVPENTKKEISWKMHNIVTVIIIELFLKEMFSSFSD